MMIHDGILAKFGGSIDMDDADVKALLVSLGLLDKGDNLSKEEMMGFLDYLKFIGIFPDDSDGDDEDDGENDDSSENDEPKRSTSHSSPIPYEDARSIAEMNKTLYAAHRDAGFTEKQAVQIIATMFGTLLSQQS